jgi:hypothetical protein
MKLGIVVVYLLKKNAGPLLQLHLDRIARHTSVPYTIYGAPLRLKPRFRQVLEEDPHVRLVDVPVIDEPRVSREHAYYLDALVRAAMDDGVTHVCVLHVDSFPVRDGWAEDLASHVSDSCIGAAVFRAENGDRVLPMPAGFLFSRQFQEQVQPRFFASREVAKSAEYRQFMQEFDAEVDSGIGYAYEIYRRGLNWHRLLRSNRHNDHYLMAGVYGDTFFHLGAAARKPRFRGDYDGPEAPPALQWWQWLDDSRDSLPESVCDALQSKLPPRETVVGDIKARNDAAFAGIFERLLADPDRYIDLLRTGA